MSEALHSTVPRLPGIKGLNQLWQRPARTRRGEATKMKRASIRTFALCCLLVMRIASAATCPRVAAVDQIAGDVHTVDAAVAFGRERDARHYGMTTPNAFGQEGRE